MLTYIAAKSHFRGRPPLHGWIQDSPEPNAAWRCLSQRMATSASTTTPLGDATGDSRVDRVLEEFSTSKGGHFGHRIQPTAYGPIASSP
jgi:hypothetical protein